MWRIIGIMKREKYIILDALSERRKKMFRAGDLVRFRSGTKIWEVWIFSPNSGCTLVDPSNRSFVFKYGVSSSKLVLVRASHV